MQEYHHSVQNISAGALEHTLFGCPGLEFADVILSLNNLQIK